MPAAAIATTPPCHSQFRISSTRYSSCVFDQLLQLPQFIRINPLVLQHVQHEEAGRALEEAGHEVSKGASPRLTLIDQRTIDERPRDLVVSDVPFRFEDAENRLDGAVAHDPPLA